MQSDPVDPVGSSCLSFNWIMILPHVILSMIQLIQLITGYLGVEEDTNVGRVGMRGTSHSAGVNIGICLDHLDHLDHAAQLHEVGHDPVIQLIIWITRHNLPERAVSNGELA